MTKWVVVIGLFICIVIGAVVLVIVPAPAKAPTAQEPATLTDLIVVASPLPKSKITSPFTVSGQARGNWYFEASAPYELLDSSGVIIAQGHIDAQSSWMTTGFVPFSATITFPAQLSGSSGTLVLKNDNPSGDPAREKELDIPVRF